MKLKCVSNYADARVSFVEGQVFEVTVEVAAILMANSPGSFEEVVERKTKALEGPPVDKAVKAPGVKK